MTKRVYWGLQLFLVLYFAAYLTATINVSTLWGNILSPVGAFAAFLLLLMAGRRTGQLFLCWLFASLACLSYGLADTVWAVHESILGLNPMDLNICLALYMLPNGFILLTTASFFILFRNNWNRFQLGIDILSISAMFLAVIWVFFLHRELSLLDFNAFTLAQFLYLLFDFFSLGCLIVWYAFLNRSKIPTAGLFFLSAILLHVMADFYFTHLFIDNAYIPNSVIDSVYILSLLLLAQAALWELRWPVDSFSQLLHGTELNKIDRKGFLLLLIPFMAIWVNGFDLQLLVTAILIFAVHQFLSNYVQTAIRNEGLLARERSINVLLEEHIAARTRELLNSNRNLELLSKQDSITSLYNRRYLLATLDQILEEVSPKESVSIIFIDIDRFKSINDLYGHDIGDQVLVSLSSRLAKYNQQHDALLARLGGDEFVFALRGPYNQQDIDQISLDIIAACSKPIVISPYQFHLSISMGISRYPTDAQKRSDLMKYADIAMYHAKSLGFNKHIFYSSLESNIRRKHIIELKLKEADYDAEFQVLYQPLFRIKGNTLIGMEALLRWKQPELGPVFPDEFIPIAEESGAIIPLGEWVIKQAVKQISEWNSHYNSQLKMGINISPRQLDSLDLIDCLTEAMTENNIPPAWLDVEITENIAMKGESSMEEIFAMISDLGITISIDDFGTGYSSLSYLKRYSFDRLKIAKPLVHNITADINDVQIIKAIIMIGRALNIKTIAEGVEDSEQLKILADLGCDEVQGYLFSHPLTADQFNQLFLHQVSSAG